MIRVSLSCKLRGRVHQTRCYCPPVMLMPLRPGLHMWGDQCHIFSDVWDYLLNRNTDLCFGHIEQKWAQGLTNSSESRSSYIIINNLRITYQKLSGPQITEICYGERYLRLSVVSCLVMCLHFSYSVSAIVASKTFCLCLYTLLPAPDSHFWGSTGLFYRKIAQWYKGSITGKQGWEA